jgi:hypothetical protein
MTHHVQFIAGDAERFFSLGPIPVREGAGLNMEGISLVCIAHRVSTKESDIEKCVLDASLAFNALRHRLKYLT